MTRQPRFASARRSRSIVNPRNVLRRASASSSWPMLAQTSVYRMSAPRAASRGSWTMSTVAPPLRAAWTMSALGSCPTGQAIRNCSPNAADASRSEWATLFLSPMNARVRPGSDPTFSQTVSMSPGLGTGDEGRITR